MRERIERIRDAVADGFANAVNDIRNKLIDESFWGRHVPERSARDGLQALWGKDVPANREPGLLDRLFAADPQHPTPTQEVSSHDQDRGPDLER